MLAPGAAGLAVRSNGRAPESAVREIMKREGHKGHTLNFNVNVNQPLARCEGGERASAALPMVRSAMRRTPSTVTRVVSPLRVT